MKKLLLVAVLIVSAFFQGSFAQDKNPSDLLTAYYSIKDALVSGNSAAASNGATEFVKTASTLNEKQLPVENKTILVREASQLSNAKDLKQQREVFESFSDNMFAYVKSAKVAGEPVYHNIVQ